MLNISIKSIVLSIVISLVLFSCSSNKAPNLNTGPSKSTIKNTPEWFLQLPSEDGFRFSTATATSRDMQLAIDKAELDAANKLAGRMNSVMDAYIKRVREENSLDDTSEILDRFSKVQDQVISTSLEGYDVVKKDLQNEGDIWRSYVLIKWDEGAADKKLLAQIKRDKELYDAIRASELVDEMEEKVEQYRQRLNN
tara:strand:- start:138 stop:725 length:588 start_codon:yes stop_codon:yes gene_type:complete